MMGRFVRWILFYLALLGSCLGEELFSITPTSASSKRLVVHDLDISIRSSLGKRYYPNGRNGPDVKNNVEKIEILEN